MAVLVATTTVRGEDGFPVVLTAGSEVPSWAGGLVGEHLLSEPVKKPATRATKVPEPDKSESEPDFTQPAKRGRRK